MKKLFLLIAIGFFVFSSHAQPLPEMILVQGGSFTMGSNSSDAEDDEKPAHTVTLSSFSIGKYEVTVGEYKAFCTASRQDLASCRVLALMDWNDKSPMQSVSFDDANAYCNWLSKTTGKNYRLPTEAEWEYAARGGNKSKGYTYAGSNDISEIGWVDDNANDEPMTCGLKKPNELGLFDMSGNVWEWCKDWSGGDYSKTPTNNPTGPSSGELRVMRGGSYGNTANESRVSFRFAASPFEHSLNFGFRIVRSQ